MPAPAGPHQVRTELEGALCAELRRQGVDHEHRSLHFRVHEAVDRVKAFEPAIVVRRGAILFLLEPLSASSTADRMELMTRFLEQHSHELVLVAVGPEPVLARLPPEAYDERYPDTDLPRIVGRIREQDPEGIVEPFPKDRGR